MSKYEELSRRVAYAIANQIKVKTGSRLIKYLAIKKWPVTYLSKWSREGQIDLVRGGAALPSPYYLDTEEQHTFHHLKNSHLEKQTNLKAGNRFYSCMTDNYDELS